MAQAAVAEIMKPEKRIRAMALLLMLATTVEFVAIVHHPHVQSRDQLQATLQIIALGPLAGWIHGIAIGCFLLIAYCLGELIRLRIPAALMRAASLVYAAGMVCWLAAATIDGWVIERLAGSFAHDTAADLENSAVVFKVCMAWVVASTNVGFVLTSVGILIGCVGLMRNSLAWRMVGGLGLLVAASLSLSIAAGHLSMDRHGAIVAVGLQGLWLVLLGVVALKAGTLNVLRSD
jgi:hypothetical protein